VSAAERRLCVTIVLRLRHKPVSRGFAAGEPSPRRVGIQPFEATVYKGGDGPDGREWMNLNSAVEGQGTTQVTRSKATCGALLSRSGIGRVASGVSPDTNSRGQPWAPARFVPGGQPAGQPRKSGVFSNHGWTRMNADSRRTPASHGREGSDFPFPDPCASMFIRGSGKIRGRGRMITHAPRPERTRGGLRSLSGSETGSVRRPAGHGPARATVGARPFCFGRTTRRAIAEFRMKRRAQVVDGARGARRRHLSRGGCDIVRGERRRAA